MLQFLTPLFPTRAERFTPTEVRARLRQDPGLDRRTAEVHAMAARTGLWADRLHPDTALELGRSAERLPSVVFWFARGLAPEAIGRRLGIFSGAWDAEVALEVAACLIAAVLNERGSDLADEPAAAR
jgi:hypothetical protein